MSNNQSLTAASSRQGELISIGEIARITGVNTVTLRAWERRFGLLKPQRTNKGHRLYSSADLAVVQEIQKWLARGLAISKVSHIVRNQLQDEEVIGQNSEWVEQHVVLARHINNFTRNSLQKSLEELFALYPIDLLADNLILPLLAQYAQAGTANAARLAFLQGVLLEQLYFSMAKLRPINTGRNILVISASAKDSRVPGLMLCYGLGLNHHASEYLHYLTQDEVLVAGSALGASALVVIGYRAMELNRMQLLLSAWSEKMSRPAILLGALGQAYNVAYENLFPNIYTAATVTEAIALVNRMQSASSSMG